MLVIFDHFFEGLQNFLLSAKLPLYQQFTFKTSINAKVSQENAVDCIIKHNRVRTPFENGMCRVYRTIC